MCLIICGIGGMMINNDSGYKFNPGTMVTHGTSMGLWLPINRTTAGINGIAGMPMVGINGHLGLLVAMMMIGGRRGHNGTVNQRSILTKSPPPEWDGTHPEKNWCDYCDTLKQWLSTTDMFPLRNTACSCGEL